MIVTRTPFRLSLAGGGTDFKEYYEIDHGACLSTTIDKYLYIVVKEAFADNIILHYSKPELVPTANDIQHPILRECLKFMEIDTGIEISSLADIPAGTGLGSSGVFTVGLLKALYAYKGISKNDYELAEAAIHIERDILNEPVGKQDQYAAAFGGMNLYRFNQDESVNASLIDISPANKKRFENNLMLLYTGTNRSASNILSVQKKDSKKNSSTLDVIRKQAYELKDLLKSNDIEKIPELFHAGYLEKKKLASGIITDEIDKKYNDALKAGALGGRIVGAGGGGFLLLYVKPEHRDDVLNAVNLNETIFSFEKQGTSIIYQN